MKCLIKWDAGYGESVDVIEADTVSSALKQAVQCAYDDFDSTVSFDANELTQDDIDNYDLDEEIEGDKSE